MQNMEFSWWISSLAGNVILGLILVLLRFFLRRNNNKHNWLFLLMAIVLSTVFCLLSPIQKEEQLLAIISGNMGSLTTQTRRTIGGVCIALCLLIMGIYNFIVIKRPKYLIKRAHFILYVYSNWLVCAVTVAWFWDVVVAYFFTIATVEKYNTAMNWIVVTAVIISYVGKIILCFLDSPQLVINKGDIKYRNFRKKVEGNLEEVDNWQIDDHELQFQMHGEEIKIKVIDPFVLERVQRYYDRQIHGPKLPV